MIRSRVLTGRLRERVIVTLKTGTSVAGVLYSHDDKALVLREAAALGEGENRADLPLDGEWIALMSNIDFLQRP